MPVSGTVFPVLPLRTIDILSCLEQGGLGSCLVIVSEVIHTIDQVESMAAHRLNGARKLRRDRQ